MGKVKNKPWAFVKFNEKKNVFTEFAEKKTKKELKLAKEKK